MPSRRISYGQHLPRPGNSGIVAILMTVFSLMLGFLSINDAG